MAKVKNDYFKLMEEQSAYCVQAAELLEEILTSSTAENIEAYKDQMHSIEHNADEIHHDILSRLTVEFITPIDQEDIVELVQLLDDITDAIDEVVIREFMYNVKRVPAHAGELSGCVNRCTNALKIACAELKNFKKPTKLRELLIDVNNIEEEADGVYVKAIHELFTDEDIDFKSLIGCKEIYESLENCCDLCEHASDVIAQIIIKNT